MAVSKGASTGNSVRSGSPAWRRIGTGSTQSTVSAVKLIPSALLAQIAAMASKRSAVRPTGWRRFAAPRRGVGKLAVLCHRRRGAWARSNRPDVKLPGERLRCLFECHASCVLNWQHHQSGLGCGTWRRTAVVAQLVGTGRVVARRSRHDHRFASHCGIEWHPNRDLVAQRKLRRISPWPELSVPLRASAASANH